MYTPSQSQHCLQNPHVYLYFLYTTGIVNSSCLHLAASVICQQLKSNIAAITTFREKRKRRDTGMRSGERILLMEHVFSGGHYHKSGHNYSYIKKPTVFIHPVPALLQRMFMTTTTALRSPPLPTPTPPTNANATRNGVHIYPTSY